MKERLDNGTDTKQLRNTSQQPKPQVKQIPTPAKIAPVAVESVKPEQVELKKKKK